MYMANAKQVLSESDIVYFLGYSFPQSDIYMDLFLKSSIQNEQKIIIVDINQSKSYKKRILDIFAPLYKRGKQNIELITSENAIDKFINDKILIRTA